MQWRFIGRTSETCDKTRCQKQMYGVMMDDDFGCPHYFRFSVTHFGVRTDGNLFHALIAPLIRKYRSKGVCLIVWVDDVLIIVPNTCVTPFTCLGVPRCAVCQSCKEEATALDVEFSEDLAELGFETNKKDVPPSQSSKFLGIIFDTRTMTFHVEDEEAALFGQRCVDILVTEAVTPKEMTRLVGVLNWWIVTVWPAKLMSRVMQSQSATCVPKEHWDVPVLLTQSVRDELVFWKDNAVTVSSFGMPIHWPRFQELFQMWERVEEQGKGQRPRYRLVSDGGPDDWGTTLTSSSLARSAASMNPRRPWTDRVLGHTRWSWWIRGAVSTNLDVRPLQPF